MRLAHHFSNLLRPQTLALAALLVVTPTLVLDACTQDEGQRCQLDSDCSDGLRCCYPITNPSPEELIAGGVCTPADKCNTTPGTDSQVDGLALDSLADGLAKPDRLAVDGAAKPDTKPDTTAKPDTKPDTAAKPDTKPDTAAAPDTTAILDTQPDTTPTHDTTTSDLLTSDQSSAD